MSEVTDELWRGALETGVAVITPEMVLRDGWERYEAGGQALMRNLEPALPPRAYSLRFSAWGPGWLSLLATCAYLREGILSPDLRLD